MAVGRFLNSLCLHRLWTGMGFRWLRRLFFFAGFFSLAFLSAPGAYGAERDLGKGEELYAGYMEEIGCQEVQDVMDHMEEGASFDFKGTVEEFLSGEAAVSWEAVLEAAARALGQGFSNEASHMARLLVIAIAGAVFVNFSNVFQSRQVADTGFFITYLLLFSAMSVTFYQLSQLAASGLERLLEFMEALLPAYFMAVAFSTGSATSLAFYETAMVALTLAETVLVKAMIPLVRIYFVVSLTNYISREDYLSKALGLLENIIRWVVKSLLGAVAGYHFIQGMVVPVADQVKNSMALRAAKMLPGVGNALGSVAETVIGAGVLVKNAVGAAGIVAILFLISMPMVKIGFYCFLYRVGEAAIQPISDKRILECLEGGRKGASLLLYLLFAGSALFLLTIAIVMVSTSQHFW